METSILLIIIISTIASASLVVARVYTCYMADRRAKCSDRCKGLSNTSQVELTKPKRGRKKKN